MDRYRFAARAGQRLVAQVRARELIPYIADAVPGWFQAKLALFDAKGKEVAYADDFRFRPDPVLSYEVAADGDYVLVSHSLGGVLIRMALPALADLPPQACFLIAPPSRACQAAKHFVERWPLLRLLTRDAGLKLADAAFMDALPVPRMPTTIYAGSAGPTGSFSPFGGARNDTVLTVDDTRIRGCDLVEVPAVHTLIMNSKVVTEDIVAATRRYAFRPEAVQAT